VATKEERAQSFGAIAEDYDRLRPTAPPAALDWLVPAGCKVAVDLAAGTGLFTRALLGRAERVIAVEPDDRMRAVLAASSPEVEALAGTGEAIPLPDASIDALFVSSAWHWLDPDRAPAEIARVIRDGGRLGVLWTSRDREVEWVRDLDRGPGDPAWDSGAETAHRSMRMASLSDTVDFSGAETQTFGFVRRMRVDDVVEMVATYSGVITAGDEARAALLEAVQQKLAARFPDAAEIDVPMRTWAWRGTRIPRA
jgi:SAM-dependent methyltransferase